MYFLEMDMSSAAPRVLPRTAMLKSLRMNLNANNLHQTARYSPLSALWINQVSQMSWRLGQDEINYYFSKDASHFFTGKSGTYGDAVRSGYHRAINGVIEAIQTQHPAFEGASIEVKAAMLHMAREQVRMTAWEYMDPKEVENLVSRQMAEYGRREGPDFQYLVLKESVKYHLPKDIAAQLQSKDNPEGLKMHVSLDGKVSFHKQSDKARQVNVIDEHICEEISKKALDTCDAIIEKDAPTKLEQQVYRKILDSAMRTSLDFDKKYGMEQKTVYVEPVESDGSEMDAGYNRFNFK